MLNEKTHKLRQKALAIFLLIYLISIFFLYLDKSIFFKCVIIMSPFFILAYFATQKKIENIASLCFFTLFFSITILSSSIVQGQELVESFHLVALSILNICLAYILNQEPISKKVPKIYLIGLFTLCFFLMLYGVNPNQFFPKSSRNTFSWLVLTGTSLFYFIFTQEKIRHNYPLWPAFFSFLISIWAQGRSGIIATGILFCGIIFCNFRDQKNWKKLFYVLGVFISLTLLMFLFIHFQEASIKGVIRRFSYEGLRESHRISIIKNYFDNLKNVKDIIFGFNIKDDPFMGRWHFNLHNSFLQLHYRVGISSVFIIFLIIKGVIRKSKNTPLFFFVALALFLRVSTDTVAFIQPYDFLFFYFVFN